MSEDQARAARIGDRVTYRGRETYITAIKMGGIAGPHFRLDGVEDGLTSYQLVRYPEGEIVNVYGNR
jgi:hypothetical protein